MEPPPSDQKEAGSRTFVYGESLESAARIIKGDDTGVYLSRHIDTHRRRRVTTKRICKEREDPGWKSRLVPEEGVEPTRY